ncbi:uncharacterized protein LOC118183557, partial [Stegodyphus dumicola]|uniref:uncharacterized protein LOC118183557 n=1 Tax=Stegodyphus dumicola TaxID=202533 RepID=UPI0015ADEB37
MFEEMNLSPLINNTVSADKNTSPVIRKSERVKKRKHEDYVTLESKKREKDPQRLEKNAVQMIAKKTGKRGRPRKYPVDVQTNCLAVCEKNQVNSTNSDTSIYVKDKHYNNVIRKCSRKGRPRKCLRYADINSGVDNESLDGITDTHINSEDGKGEIDCEGKISHSKQILVSEKNTEASKNIESCSECSNCNNEEAEKLILPLKKRKQMAGYKVSKELCTLHTKPCKCEVEKLEPPKKKSEKLSKNSTSDASKENGSENDTISGNTQGSKLLEQQRNLRSHTATRAQKNTVASTAGKRRKSVDLNGNETDFVHLKKSKQSKSFEEDSTAVEEVEESPGKVSYEKACYNSNYLALKQNYAEFVTPSILQDYKQMKSSSFVSKLNNVYTVEPISKSCGRNSFAGIFFPSYKPKKSTWHCLLGKEFEESLPPLKNSLLLKIEKTWLKEETDWFQLNCFDSTPLDVTSNHLTFFAGGPIWSAAWCPTPNIQTTQYIALATGSSINNYYSYTDTPEEKGLLQLWNVGHLGSALETKPLMQLGIAHEHGIVWDMVWCPSGCWEDPNSECSSDDMPCLGLLAVACSNSNIYIYSIPQPESLPSFTETAPLYSTSPSAVLHPLFGDPCFGTRKSMCVSLCWQKNDACERIAGGYGNGMICVWLVNSSATIIMKNELQKAIAPYLVFQAHGTPVLSLAFAALPGNRWLVSSSFDKTLKFWDLIDTSMPFCSLRKGIARCAQWSPQCCGVYACLDDGLSFKGSSLFKECGIEQIPVRSVSANCNPAKVRLT